MDIGNIGSSCNLMTNNSHYKINHVTGFITLWEWWRKVRIFIACKFQKMIYKHICLCMFLLYISFVTNKLEKDLYLWMTALWSSTLNTILKVSWTAIHFLIILNVVMAIEFTTQVSGIKKSCWLSVMSHYGQ